MVVVFSKPESVLGEWVWRQESLPVLDSSCYLGIEFGSNGSWDKHIKALLTRGKQKLGSLYRVLRNFVLDLKTCRHTFVAALRPSLEYGCAVWNATKCRDKALESVQLRA